VVRLFFLGWGESLQVTGSEFDETGHHLEKRMTYI
jgi:hypothetical protein